MNLEANAVTLPCTEKYIKLKYLILIIKARNVMHMGKYPTINYRAKKEDRI
jgi:hypothetical protein